jgi:hypothetical protein
MEGGLSEIRRYRDFWPHYLRQHTHPRTRYLHYVGSVFALTLISVAVITGDLTYFGWAILTGYGFSWIGHAFVEGNAPATFSRPIWSLISDMRMLAYFAVGRLEHELHRHITNADRSPEKRQASESGPNAL